MPGLHVRKGDTVQVISGKDRGLKGKVLVAFPTRNRVLVEGANRIKKHTRVTTTQRGAQSGGIVTQEAPLHVSNVQVVCPSCGKPSRLGHRRDDDGRSVRTCRRCGSDIGGARPTCQSPKPTGPPLSGRSGPVPGSSSATATRSPERCASSSATAIRCRFRP